MFTETLQLLALNLLPQHSVSRLAGALARLKLSKPLIGPFARKFAIETGEAEKPLEAYDTLTGFFIRRLKPGSRPIAPGADVAVSPVDGRVSAFGPMVTGQLWQVKGMNYSLIDLLNGDAQRASRYAGGDFITIYLSPRDYHRIHMPLAGKLTAASYVPGSLFPVNPFAVTHVSNLFARNERIITYAQTGAGEVAVIKVGATMVGSVKVVYGNLATNLWRRRPQTLKIAGSPWLAKGDELGWFEFGSTVILLFEKGRIRFRPLHADMPVRLGQAIADVR